MTTFQLKMGGWQTNGTADLWAGRVVVRRFGFPSPANRVPRKDVRFAHSSQPAEGMRAASRVGFPSPPRVSRPKEDDRCRDLWCRRPKSLTAPSAAIYEMTSSRQNPARRRNLYHIPPTRLPVMVSGQEQDGRFGHRRSIALVDQRLILLDPPQPWPICCGHTLP